MVNEETAVPQYRKVRILTKGPKKRPEVLPRCEELEIESNEQIKWVISPDDVKFTVRFKGEGPFEENVFDQDNNISGPPKYDPDENDKFYAYTLEVEDHITIDPGVIIWRR